MTNSKNETRWSLVVLATGNTPASRAALSELCDIYYAPVHGLMKRWAGPEEARDLTHAFFARILESDSLGAADPKRGKFWNFLFGAAKHFLHETIAKEKRLKRGGNVHHLALDDVSISDSKTPSPDVEFDRIWACALIERCLTLLSGEMEKNGKSEAFEVLRPWLAGSADHGDQQHAAEVLGISEMAVRVAVHRMRKRLREIIESETAQTLEPEDDVAAELRLILGAW